MSNEARSTRETILAAIKEATGRPLPAVIEGDTSVYDLGIDSMSLVEMIFKLEADLSIDIPLAELNESIFENLNSLTTYLDSRKHAGATASALSDAEIGAK